MTFTQAYRGYSGAISLPQNVADLVQMVAGLDNRLKPPLSVGPSRRKQDWSRCWCRREDALGQANDGVQVELFSESRIPEIGIARLMPERHQEVSERITEIMKNAEISSGSRVE